MGENDINIPPPPGYQPAGVSGHEYQSLVAPETRPAPAAAPMPGTPSLAGGQPDPMAGAHKQFVDKIAGKFEGVPQTFLEQRVAMAMSKRMKQGAEMRAAAAPTSLTGGR